MGAQVMGLHALERTWAEATDKADREAVTTYVERAVGRFRVGTLRAEQNLAHLRLTIENEGDLELARQVYATWLDAPSPSSRRSHSSTAGPSCSA